MRSIFMCLVFLCTLTAAAQDVIVKKDGSTIICRVVELGKTEVIYKRWSDLQGNNYVMNLTDVKAINYENGEKKTFEAIVGDSIKTTEQELLNKEPVYLDDAELLDFVENANKVEKVKKPVDINKKIKNLKAVGWTIGLIGITTGGILIGTSASGNSDLTAAPGALICAGSLIITTGCVARANNLKRRNMNRVVSTAVWENDFKFKNNSSLSTQICSIKDSHQLAPTLGLGLNYQF